MSVLETFLTCGLDVGARSVKIAVLSHQEARSTILASVLVRSEGHPYAEVGRAAIRESWRQVLADAGLSAGDIDYVVSTGTCDSEVVGMGRHPGRSSHALGARLLFPDAVAALDIGASEIRCGLVSEPLIGRRYAMARIARRTIGETVDEADDLAGRAVGLVRTLAVEGKIVLTGGMVLDADFVGDLWSAILRTRGSESNVSLLISPEAIFAGAYGAAILAAGRFLRLSHLAGPVPDPFAERILRIDRRTLN